jgi:CopG family nickel-responsive transcriptional regulator
MDGGRKEIVAQTVSKKMSVFMFWNMDSASGNGQYNWCGESMPQLSRTGVSIEEDLLKEFDRLIERRGYQNRSEAFRDLIREALLTELVESNKPVVGTLTLVYDHHVPNLAQKLTEVQHGAGTMILAATHVHLDHSYCLEVIIMRGRSKDLQAVADGMLALRGVELGKLVLTNSGKDLKRASHSH